MDLTLSPEEEAFRDELRAWLEARNEHLARAEAMLEDAFTALAKSGA